MMRASPHQTKPLKSTKYQPSNKQNLTNQYAALNETGELETNELSQRKQSEAKWSKTLKKLIELEMTQLD